MLLSKSREISYVDNNPAKNPRKSTYPIIIKQNIFTINQEFDMISRKI